MANSSARMPDNSGARIFPPAVYILGLVVGFAIHLAWPVHIASGGWVLAVRIVGAALILIWIALTAWALMTFRRAGTPVNPRETVTTIARGGPYRYTRNPMYLAMALGQAGFAFLFNSLWPLIALIPVIWVIRVMVIAREESYLERKFGDQYLDLRKSVRRWL
jgi:protein-S-isoprenylcysteine O-methyltransferase Ste14